MQNVSLRLTKSLLNGRIVNINKPEIVTVPGFALVTVPVTGTAPLFPLHQLVFKQLLQSLDLLTSCTLAVYVD